MAAAEGRLGNGQLRARVKALRQFEEMLAADGTAVVLVTHNAALAARAMRPSTALNAILDAAGFDALVQDAKMKCPISKALNPSIAITATTAVK